VTAESIPASARTEECASGCATAKTNLAELAERGGKLADALALFNDAEGISKSIGFEEGTKMASSGRKRVQQAMKSQG